MKLATFTHAEETRIGVLKGGEMIDLKAVAPDLPTEMCALLAAGVEPLATARSAAARASDGIPLGQLQLESPILRPPKILAVGLNYADHVAETGQETPKHPIIFNKQSTAAHPPYAPFTCRARPMCSIARASSGS